MALKANQTDSIATAGGIDTDDTAFTLTTGAFDTKTSGDKVPLIIDYDNTAKLEVVLAYVNGTAVTAMVRAQDGTAAVAHSQLAKVCIGSVPSAWDYWIKNDSSNDAFVGARAYLAATLGDTVGDTNPQKITFTAEEYDEGGNFASSKFVAPVDGYYLINANTAFSPGTDAKYYECDVYKNGAFFRYGEVHGSTTLGLAANVSDVVKLNATDYIELYYSHNAANTTDLVGGAIGTFLSVTLLKEV
jgi:hypothetical protein